MTMNKQTNIPLETTAKYQPLSNLDVNFYTRDIQTSILNFIVTRNHKPLLLGESNVVTNISLEFEDGSIVRDDLTIKDGINGILSYTLSDEMLRHTGKVTGQVDIAIKGKEDTVVERLFSFNISKTLIDSIDAETKLIHIKRFSDLEKNITERYERMEETFANGENLAQAVLDASTKGLDDLTSAKTKSLNEIKTSKDSTLKEITNTGSNYTNQLNTVYNTMDEKINKFNTDVQAGGYVKSSITDNWQKHKLTNDNGNSTHIDGINMEDVEEKITRPGYYWLSSVTNGPVNINGVLLAIHGASDNYKKIFYMPHNSNRVFLNSKNGSTWINWEEITKSQTDTGWLPITIKNGYNKSTIPDFEPSYRVIDYGTYKKLYVRLGVANLTNGKNTVASIPTELNPYKIYSLGVSTIAKIPPKVVVSGGNIEVHPNSSDSYIDTDYVIYQDEWII